MGMKIICFSIFIALFIYVLYTTIREIVVKNRSKISFMESMNLTDLPVITFTNNDTKLNFLLDTGSDSSYINNSILNNIQHTKLKSTTSVTGFEGNEVKCSLCKMQIAYKNKIFDEQFVITDLDKAFSIIKANSGVSIHGILGNKFFKKYKYVIDFKDLVAYIK